MGEKDLSHPNNEKLIIVPNPEKSLEDINTPKLQKLENSELSKLKGFDTFLEYLKKRIDISKSTEEIDAVISILNSDRKNNLIQYFDEDDVKGKGFFYDKKSYEYFINKFNLSKTSKIIEETDNKQEKEKNKNTENKNENTENKNENTKNKNENTKDKNKIKEDLNILSSYPSLKDIISKIENEKDFEKKLEIAKQNQKVIFDTILGESKKTGNYDNLKKVANSFYGLGIIDTARFDELMKEIPKNPLQINSNQNSVLGDYEKRGDELFKRGDGADFTLKDGTLTCESKSGTLLKDYGFGDKELKAYEEKTKLQKDLDDLNTDLGDKQKIGEIIGKISLNQKNYDLNSLYYDISKELPNLKKPIDDIINSGNNYDDKIKYIIGTLYAYMKGNISSLSEIRGLDINDMINKFKQELEIIEKKIEADIKTKKDAIDKIDKEYPDLDKKSLDKKIKDQERYMKDSVRFCDDYGLSSIGPITVIKDFTELINEKEIYNPIKTDFGTGEEYKKGKEKYCKYMARLLGRNENEIFKKDGSGLLEFDATTKKPITKDYLKNLLEKNWVVVNGQVRRGRMKELIGDDEKIEINNQLNN